MGSSKRPDPPPSRTTGRDLSPRTLAGRRRDQLTKAPDYGAALVAITVAQFYLSGMSQRTLPAGFIAPCLPTKTDPPLRQTGIHFILTSKMQTGDYGQLQ